MSNEIIFYTHPMSRGRVVRWMLEEVGQPYRTERLDYGTTMKAPAYLAINPMGKVPAITHGDAVVTECAAICAYLAEAQPGAELAPHDSERADYFRWLFFAAGPVEQAVTARALGFEPPADKQGMAGFGSFERTMDALESLFADGRSWVCGDHFTMADVYVGSQVDWGLTFGTMPPRMAFVAYAERLQQRDAYKAAKAIDSALIAEMRK